MDMTEVNVTHTYTHTPHFDVREYTVLKLLALGKLGGILVFFSISTLSLAAGCVIRNM